MNMALFIKEDIDIPVEILTEEVDGKKTFFIEGIFAQSEVVNKNKRKYPRSVMESATDRYIKEYVSTRRAMGEMNHPQRLNVDPERATHLITEMSWKGNDVIGKARVLSTPMGDLVRGLIESGVNLGVSTRGAGSVSLKEGINVVGSDLVFTAVDVVSDPSGPNCFVNGIMEGVEWVNINGVWESREIEETQTLIKRTPSKQLDEAALQVWQKLMSRLSSSL